MKENSNKETLELGLDESLLSGILGGTEVVGDEESAASKTLDYYESMMKEQKEIPSLAFSQARENEGLYYENNGITVFMPKEEAFFTRSKHPIIMSYMLGRRYSVLVKSVDREKKLVIVSFVDVQKKYTPIALAKLKEALKDGKQPVVTATVRDFREGDRRLTDKASAIGIENSRYLYCAILDIFGLNIVGHLHIADWSESFTQDLRDELHRGDRIKVAVLSQDGTFDNGEPTFRCSRKAVTGGADWRELASKYHFHDSVLIEARKCGAKMFNGRIIGGPNYNVYCYYPDAKYEKIKIEEGRRYVGYISKIDPETKTIRVRIRGYADETVDNK